MDFQWQMSLRRQKLSRICKKDTRGTIFLAGKEQIDSTENICFKIKLWFDFKLRLWVEVRALNL